MRALPESSQEIKLASSSSSQAVKLIDDKKQTNGFLKFALANLDGNVLRICAIRVLYLSA